MSMDENFGDQPPVDQKPTVKSLHDRMMNLEIMVESLVDHVENSLGFKVARRPADAPSEPDVSGI